MFTCLEDIFDQAPAIETLRNAWRSQRLPHGLIFAGPSGVGKSTTARALATLFLCENPKGDRPCGSCESCTLMSAQEDEKKIAHPDFHFAYRQLIRQEKESSKARDLAIDVIRAHVLEPASRKPTMRQGKVFVIKEAELMSSSAQNALLKTLEEPYGRTLLILLTDQPDLLLPTIRSRAQIVRFAALSFERVRMELERRKIDRAAADQAAKLSEGSLGAALHWIEDGVIESAMALNQRIDALLKGKPVADLADWLKTAAETYAKRQLEHDDRASKDQATREGLALYLRIAASHFRRVLAQAGDVEVLSSVCSAIDAVAIAETNLDANLSVGLTLQQLTTALDYQFSHS